MTVKVKELSVQVEKRTTADEKEERNLEAEEVTDQKAGDVQHSSRQCVCFHVLCAIVPLWRR
jgi:hypothetical protein